MFEGKLVFAAGDFGDYDIFLYDLSSKKLTQLTSGEAWNDYPRFSPDARKIAFGSTRSGKQEIWIMNADGSDANAPLYRAEVNGFFGRVREKIHFADKLVYSGSGTNRTVRAFYLMATTQFTSNETANESDYWNVGISAGSAKS